MLTLSAIALASSLAFAPVHTGSYTTASAQRYERARLTLDRMTSEAQNRLRNKNIEEALNSGIRTFKMALNEQLDAQIGHEVALSPVQESNQPATTK
ncbi:MAG TPA: hypothetical protein VFA48_02855 [Gammaproteobacteria bacterium]|nr:hypothetical protein [Gammaproteobacteria bacterium]